MIRSKQHILQILTDKYYLRKFREDKHKDVLHPIKGNIPYNRIKKLEAKFSFIIYNYIEIPYYYGHTVF